MVTAGVFLVARCNPIFNLSEVAMNTVAVVGALTMFFASTIALVQNDIKRVIAFSTCSHLGYMFLACGVGAYAAGIFHLYTHAFFKALLFLAAGSVIHAVHTNDIQEMGGLKKYMPITYFVFVVAGLSAMGFPGLSGFFSKDEIIWSAYASDSPVGKFVWLLAVSGAFFTPFYTFRLIFLTFHGTNRGVHHSDPHSHGSHGSHGEHHIHESPWVMTVPLMFLAVGAVAAGWIGIPPILGGGAHFAEFLKPVVGHPEFHGTHAEEWAVMGLSTLLAFTGLGLAMVMYLRKSNLPAKLASAFSGVYKVLYNKYYVDELYSYTIVKPTLWLANKVVLAITDGKIIEGVVNGVPGSIGWFSEKLRKVQTGLAQHYGIMMAAGAVFIIAVVLFLQ